MSTRRESRKKFQERYSESGHFCFSLTQTDSRFALCKEALIFENGVIVKLKRIYFSMGDVEACSLCEFDSVSSLSDRYEKLDQVGYGGKFEKYEKQYCPEGALFPFVRVRGRKNFQFIDTGCIWIGTRFEYPRVFVRNEVANWLCPYSPGGYVRKDPFRPYHQVIQILPRLMNKAHHPDIEIPGLL